MELEQIRKILAEQFSMNEDDITMDTSFTEDIGADSLDLVELVMALEQEFDLEIDDDEVEKIKNRGYNAMEYYISSEKVRSVIDKLNSGIGNEVFSDIADYLLGHADHKDSYMCLADFDAYIDAYEKMDKILLDFWL